MNAEKHSPASSVQSTKRWVNFFARLEEKAFCRYQILATFCLFRNIIVKTAWGVYHADHRLYKTRAIGSGILGILLAGLYVFATTEFQTRQEIAMAVFTAVVQGILVAGLSTYVDQLLGQRHKSCEKEEKEE